MYYMYIYKDVSKKLTRNGIAPQGQQQMKMTTTPQALRKPVRHINSIRKCCPTGALAVGREHCPCQSMTQEGEIHQNKITRALFLLFSYLSFMPPIVQT